MPGRVPTQHVHVTKGNPVILHVGGKKKGDKENTNRSMGARLARDQLEQADRLANNLANLDRAAVDARSVLKKAATVGHKTPFYPPPNKTKVVGKPNKSLRQGRARVHLDDAEPWDVVDMVPTHLEDNMVDLHAKVESYQDKIGDLDATVENLRDKLDYQQMSEEQRLADDVHQRDVDRAIEEEVVRRDYFRRGAALGDPFAYPPGGSDPIPPAPGLHPAAAAALHSAHLSEYPYTAYPAAELANLRYRAELNPHVIAERERLLCKLTETEAINRRLNESLLARDSHIATLEEKVSHTGRLQDSFEKLKEQMRDTKHRLQAELKEKTIEVIHKDEECRQLRDRSKIVVESAGQVKATSAAEIQQLKDNAAADLAMTQAAVRGMSEDAAKHRAAADTKCRDLKHKYKAASKEASHARAQAEASEARITALEAQIAALEGRLTHADAEARRRDTEAFEAQREIGEQQVQLANCMREKAEMQRRLDAAAADAQAVEQQLEQLNSESQKITANLHQAQQELDQMRRVLDITNGTVRDQEVEIARLNRENADEKQRVVALEDCKARLEAAKAVCEEDLAAQRQATSALELRARTQIEDLEGELRKAVLVTENLDKVRIDQERVADAKIWDLKEQLDYANTAKRSLQNYAGYVRSAYQEVFDSAKI